MLRVKVMLELVQTKENTGHSFWLLLNHYLEPHQSDLYYHVTLLNWIYKIA